MQPTDCPPWQDLTRLPDLSVAAAERLRFYYEHPDAPQFTGRSGHKLSRAELAEIYQDKQRYQGAPQNWLPPFLQRCRTHVPFYQEYPWHLDFHDLPCISRADLSNAYSQFVPTDIEPDQLIAFETSGTTGHPLVIPSLPKVAARYHYFHELALGWQGVELTQLAGDVGVMLVGSQERCFTYASVSPYWDDKVLLKINLNPQDWPSPQARERYFDVCQPLLITGDPRSLSDLLALNLKHKPQAILSTSMVLLDGLKQQLEQRFACPVINLYSMNEAGPIAADDGSGYGLRLLQNELKVEILDAHGQALPLGERGEITLTGGFNPCIPLLRYRTGDFANLALIDGVLYLQQLDGRPPVRYKTATGWLNNVDITHVLQPFCLSQYQFHQDAQGDILLRFNGSADAQQLIQSLQQAFGTKVNIQALPLGTVKDKIIQYTSDYLGGKDA